MTTRQNNAAAARWRPLVAVAAAVLLAAAITACDPRNSGTSNSDLVRYSPTAGLVPALDTPAAIHLGTPTGPLLAAGCDADDLREFADGGPDGSEWRAVTQIFQEPERNSRIVFFATKRLDNQQQYDVQLAQYDTWFGEPCIGSVNGRVEMEPLSLDGLPDGALTVRWPGHRRNSISTVLGDREHLMMMAVVWQENPDPVPTDAFVETVNSAWSDFVAAND